MKSRGRVRKDGKRHKKESNIDQGVEGLMLGDWVEFKARIQKGLRIQIPVKARWAHKLEAGETFRVKLTVDYEQEKFYASMSQDGRITIPQRIAKEYPQEGEKLAGCTAELILYPVKRSKEEYQGCKGTPRG